MNAPPPSYAEAMGSTPIIISFYRFAYVRINTRRGRRIGKLLAKRDDVVLISNDTSILEFDAPLVERAAQLFGFDETSRVAFNMILRAQGCKDIVVTEGNWEAVCRFLTTPGTGNSSARLIMAIGPVVQVTRMERFAGLFLEAKRKLLGWTLPMGLI